MGSAFPASAERVGAREVTAMSTALTPSMQRLVEELKRLPGIGEKTATRLAFYVLRSDHSFAADLAQALLSVKEQSRLCSVCFGLTEQDPVPRSAPTRGVTPTRSASSRSPPT